jgi:hypothetical protein
VVESGAAATALGERSRPNEVKKVAFNRDLNVERGRLEGTGRGGDTGVGGGGGEVGFTLSESGVQS